VRALKSAGAGGRPRGENLEEGGQEPEGAATRRGTATRRPAETPPETWSAGTPPEERGAAWSAAAVPGRRRGVGSSPGRGASVSIQERGDEEESDSAALRSG
jgi:hypothetical protein